jgi:hypothetical protein
MWWIVVRWSNINPELLESNFFQIHFNIFILSIPRSLVKYFLNISHLPMHAICLTHFTQISGDEYKIIWSMSFCNFLHTTVTFPLFRKKIAFCSQTPSIHIPPYRLETKFPINTEQQVEIQILFLLIFSWTILLTFDVHNLHLL